MDSRSLEVIVAIVYVYVVANVYCCLLDASKAFDKVHYGKLFTILLARNVSPLCYKLTN